MLSQSATKHSPSKVGVPVGAAVPGNGEGVSTVGVPVGAAVLGPGNGSRVVGANVVGAGVRRFVGALDGAVVGAFVGAVVGAFVGAFVGANDGVELGLSEGTAKGGILGLALGLTFVGASVGVSDGVSEGASVAHLLLQLSGQKNLTVLPVLSTLFVHSCFSEAFFAQSKVSRFSHLLRVVNVVVSLNHSSLLPLNISMLLTNK
mmetsp:Transcript_34857/g.40063  ORF Transcript_34857/g.40063 Transcript_34857/m.40063 type:complete len:204 (-) Transcript_34857:160-771(-)